MIECAQVGDCAKGKFDLGTPSVWGPNVWKTIHERSLNFTYANEPEMKWLKDEVPKLLPCEECREHWLKMLVETPPNLQSVSSYFQWTVDRHNEVNRKLNKPERTVEQVTGEWAMITLSAPATPINGHETSMLRTRSKICDGCPEKGQRTKLTINCKAHIPSVAHPILEWDCPKNKWPKYKRVRESIPAKKAEAPVPVTSSPVDVTIKTPVPKTIDNNIAWRFRKEVCLKCPNYTEGRGGKPTEVGCKVGSVCCGGKVSFGYVDLTIGGCNENKWDDANEKGVWAKANLPNFFDRVVVLTLKRRQDRLNKFFDRLKEIGFPFKTPEVYYGADGSKLPLPAGWEQAGSGAWGCAQGQQQILQRAVEDGIQNLLIFEDDAVFRDDFVVRAAAFLRSLPNDWDGLMLGGQHMAGVQPVQNNPNIVKCVNTQRTHAYAVRGKLIREWYAKIASVIGHCDHTMGPFFSAYNVYSPKRFLSGQAASYSDIRWSEQPEKWWEPPEADDPIVLLRLERNEIDTLRKQGFHFGYTIDGDGWDAGLRDLIQTANVTPQERERRMRDFLNTVQWEAATTREVCSVWFGCKIPDQSYVQLLRTCAGDRFREVFSMKDALTLRQSEMAKEQVRGLR